MNPCAERPGSPTPGQWCSIVNRGAIPAFGAAGLFAMIMFVSSIQICRLWSIPLL
jgi:hypothetical protein